MAKEKKRAPTIAERKDEAIRKIGRDGAVVVLPSGKVVSINLKLGRKRRAATKGSNRKPPPQRAGEALVQGYKVARDLAEVRRDTCEAESTEWKAWNKIFTYCEMMREFRLVDEPETKVDYLPLDERIIDRRTLSTAMDEDELPEWTPYQDMALKASLAMLSEQERVVVQMYYGAQMKQRVIAEMLGITRQAVGQYLVNANKKWEELRVD